MLRTDLDFKGEKVVAGMLVKSRDHYEFFRHYFENNWLQIQACNSFDLNSKDDPSESEQSGHFEGLFYQFLCGSLITTAFICCFGLGYEIYRDKSKLPLYEKKSLTTHSTFWV